MVFILWVLCFFVDTQEIHKRELLHVKQTILNSWSGWKGHNEFGKLALGL